MPGIVSVVNRSPRRSMSIPTHRSSSFDSYLTIPRTPSPQTVTEDDIIEGSFIDLTQSITPEHYPEIPTHLIEDVWFDVNPHNYHGLVNPHAAPNFYAERIQAYRQARDEQARRVTESVPLVEDVLTGGEFHDPEQQSLSSSPIPVLRNSLGHVTFRDRVRIHTLATLDLTPQRIGTLVHRHRSTVVRVLG